MLVLNLNAVLNDHNRGRQCDWLELNREDVIVLLFNDIIGFQSTEYLTGRYMFSCLFGGVV